MGIPLAYLHATTDEFTQPMVCYPSMLAQHSAHALDRGCQQPTCLPMQAPAQFCPEVREVLERQGNTSVIWDYSQPNYDQLQARRARFWTPL